MLKNTHNSYGSLTRLFHWLMALIIIGIIAVGFTMTSLDPSNQKWFLYAQHKAFGVIILALIPLRLIWRLVNPQPNYPPDLPKWQDKAATYNIRFLYLCMILMPCSGFIMSTFGGHPISMFGLFTIDPFFKKHALAGLTHEVHEVLAWGIAAAVGLHIVAALYHHFILKNSILRRMLTGVQN